VGLNIDERMNPDVAYEKKLLLVINLRAASLNRDKPIFL
jgi:hypothetical protein